MDPQSASKGTEGRFKKQSTKKVMGLFNIAENDNETTNNYVNVNLKQKIEDMKQQKESIRKQQSDSDSTRINSASHSQSK